MNTKDELFTTVRKLVEPLNGSQRNSQNLFKIQDGSFLEYNNKTFYVKELLTYQERKKSKVIDSWNECEAICLEEDGATYFIEVEEDDGLKIYFSHTILKLRDLTIKKSDLNTIVENEGHLVYNKEKFYYEDDYHAFISKSDEKVYLIDFEDDHGNFLTIEQYEDDEVRAYISSLVENVEVIAI